MAQITLKGNPIHTSGELPAVGSLAPDFTLTNLDLEDVDLAAFKGRKKLLNIVPSLDTPVCAKSTRRFEEEARARNDLEVLIVSADLPFAQKRFSDDAGLSHVKPLSMMRNQDFGKAYGVLIEDGPLAGVTARAIVVIDEDDQVVYTEMVPEIGQEPDYEKALAAAG